MVVKKLIDFLLQRYPLENAEIWDPTGFSVKFNQREKLKNVVTAIDLTSEVLNYAIANDANVIITHHPFKFEKKWNDEAIKAPYKAKFLEKLKKYRIFVFAMHTNYDNSEQGTSYQIACKLGLEKNRVSNESHYPCVLKVNSTFNDIVALIENKLNLFALRTNVKKNDNFKIKKLAILSGSGFIGQINELKTQGVDLIITSDIKWSDWIVYKETKNNLLEIPHLDEEVFAIHIIDVIKEEFPELNITHIKVDEPYRNI